MSWILFAIGCLDLRASDEASTGFEPSDPFPADGGSPDTDQTGTEYGGGIPRYQAHTIVVPIDVDGAVVLDEVQWTWSIADTLGYELCSDTLSVLSVEPVDLTKDETGILASWTFELADDPLGPCSYDPPSLVGVTIAGPDSRLVPLLAPNEAWDGADLYSFALRLDASTVPILHGVASTDELLAGDSLLVEKGPLPEGAYRLEPLLYLDLP